MKKITLFILLNINLFAGGYTINDDVFTKNGWEKPIHRELRTSTNYDYNSPVYTANFGFHHGAVDMYIPKDETVYAIDDGVIVELYRDTVSTTKNVSIIYVKHKTDTGKEFLAIYGHTYALNNLKLGSSVSKGEALGIIKRFNTPDHIHFGIGLDVNCHPSKRTNQLFGGIKCGIVNPIDFLKTNKNDTSISNNENAGIFDGAGSLINPKGNGYGHNYDIAKMHSHPGTGSTVVFQWLYDSDTCSQLDISSQYDIGDVVIKSKKWNEHLTQQAFKVKLNEDAPITMYRPNKDATWITFAVTTTKPLEFSNRITAKCKTSNDRFKRGIRSDINKDLIDVTYDYFWTGTGSIISDVYRVFNAPYGITTDLASTFNSKNSLTSFQWLKQGACQKLKISDKDNLPSSINAIHIKEWDAETWGESKCDSLPCILNPSNDDYYVIKVKSSPDAIKSGQLKAECIQ